MVVLVKGVLVFVVVIVVVVLEVPVALLAAVIESAIAVVIVGEIAKVENYILILWTKKVAHNAKKIFLPTILQLVPLKAIWKSEFDKPPPLPKSLFSITLSNSPGNYEDKDHAVHESGMDRVSRVMRFYDNSSWAWQEIFVK